MATFWCFVKRMGWFGVFTACLCLSAEAGTTRIVLKDGTIEESERVWESERFVHFILKGTQTVEVRYAREIVERIEREPDSVTPMTDSQESAISGSTPPPSAPRTQLPDTPRSPDATSDVADPRPAFLDRRMIDTHRDIGFFDPRRPQRYWASRNSRHTSLHAALDALAAQYRQERQWVIAHMGDENDLGLIHANLIATLEGEIAGVGLTPVTSNHSTGDASKALAETASSPSPMPLKTDASFEGVAFYNPRRPQKYWSTPLHRHDALEDALASLAGMYGVSPDWVLEHMGEANDLAQIHRRIQGHLPSENAR